MRTLENRSSYHVGHFSSAIDETHTSRSEIPPIRRQGARAKKNTSQQERAEPNMGRVRYHPDNERKEPQQKKIPRYRYSSATPCCAADSRVKHTVTHAPLNNTRRNRLNRRSKCRRDSAMGSQLVGSARRRVLRAM